MTLTGTIAEDPFVARWRNRGRKRTLWWIVYAARALSAAQRSQRAIRELQALDPRSLADIGLRSGGIESAVRRGRSSGTSHG
jgi:uncharacterized protein YjiS (DUF1127 family)